MEPTPDTREDVSARAAPSPAGSARDVTVEDLLVLVARMAAHAPHVPCPEGSGPLAPLAVALNQLSLQQAMPAHTQEDPFGPQTLVAQAENFMMACDTQANIRFCNRTFVGLTQADVLGKSLYDWITPESTERTRLAFQKVLDTGEPALVESQGTGLAHSMWYVNQLSPIRVGERIVGIASIVNDITELKKTQLRLERSNRELESFAYVASHDLQEPLRKIQTFGERLKTTCSSRLPPEGNDYIERMQKAATRMRGLIDDLLTFSRVTSKSRPFTPVDLSTVTREVLGDLETQLEKTGAQVSLGELPVLDADPTQMRQLLQNLLGNALKFRREGVPPILSVRTRVDAHTQRCELMVEDNGIGFEEKYTDRIFNVFQRLHGRGQYEGSGIGLAICRKIAERHGGHITAHSTPGVGSTFCVSLPLRQSINA